MIFSLGEKLRRLEEILSASEADLQEANRLVQELEARAVPVSSLDLELHLLNLDYTQGLARQAQHYINFVQARIDLLKGGEA